LTATFDELVSQGLFFSVGLDSLGEGCFSLKFLIGPAAHPAVFDRRFLFLFLSAFAVGRQ